MNIQPTFELNLDSANLATNKLDTNNLHVDQLHSDDLDPIETLEWMDSLQSILRTEGQARATYLLAKLCENAQLSGATLPFALSSPYINTIPVHQQPVYPGDAEIEERIEAINRWNAMALVTQANTSTPGIGGHISTYASAATLLEVGFNHFFQAHTKKNLGDHLYFQPHTSPGIYARAFLEGRFSIQQLKNFRRELAKDGGLSSYPHPWTMPDFWEFPTASMGLSAITSIYHARFHRYLHDRGIQDTSGSKVWAFLGDGECDEPEALGALSLAAREQLDNLIFVVNCNLQRLDGPVRGNGKIIQELESVYRGAGWNVIKVIWGSGWDSLLAEDRSGLLVKRMNEVPDGQFQKYTTERGSYVRDDFFGKYPELLEMVKNFQPRIQITRGGHDRVKLYAAYHRAMQANGKPTVILAKTVKGYGLGEAGEGRNVTHQQKRLSAKELLNFRDRFEIPLNDEQAANAVFYRPENASEEIQYLNERRNSLGGWVPSRSTLHPKNNMPALSDFSDFFQASLKPVSTTMGFVRLLIQICKDQHIGKQIVPIVPDESRTFGMEGMFPRFGIYSRLGQNYSPVDAQHVLYYKEAKDGQILEEGITEAGAMSSFIAAGTAYANHGINMIPFYIFYSMFGFQRIGDLVWNAADARAKGFMIGGTAGRTTLNGEGTQHQDGQSLLNAIGFPNVRSYDPAYVYELAVIIQAGMKRLYEEEETAIYYITVENENYLMPAFPQENSAAIQEGIIKGMYPLQSVAVNKSAPSVQLMGSGSILQYAIEAQQILAERFEISSQVWSVTSYNELYREARSCRRWNMLHPGETKKQSYLERVTKDADGPWIAASDYHQVVAEQLSSFLPDKLFALGTDGMGRSETRPALRRHFEIDAECIVLAALYQLAEKQQISMSLVQLAMKELDIDPEKIDPFLA